MRKNMLLIMLIIAVLSGCSKKEEIEEVEKEATVTAVKTETLKESTLYETLTTNGNIKVESSLEVYSAVNGRVIKSNLALGKLVKKGDVIAVIDPSVAGGRFAMHEVLAPIGGTVLSNPLQNGSIITTETRLAVIGDLSKLQVSAFIPERFYGQLKLGQKAELTVETYPGEAFSAKVKSISPLIDEDSRTCEVILNLDKNSSKIVAGMFADIKLYLKAYENVISVPSNCISTRLGEDFVYTAGSDNSVKLVKIETAQTVENRVIVTAGLKAGDKIITEGFETLVDDALVNIVSSN